MKHDPTVGYNDRVIWGFFLCMGVTYFLSLSHWFNLSLDINYAILVFSVTCVKQGDVLAPFPKEQAVTSHEHNSSGRKHLRPFDPWEEEGKLACWSLTSKKYAKSWTTGLSISHVHKFWCRLSRSSCVRVLHALFADGCTEGWLCAKRTWHGGTGEQFAKSPFMYSMR